MAITRPMVNSATAVELVSPAWLTMMLRARAAARSTPSKPVPKQEMSPRFGRESISAALVVRLPSVMSTRASRSCALGPSGRSGPIRL